MFLITDILGIQINTALLLFWYERYFDEPTSIFLPPSLKPSVEWTEITRCANIYRVPPNGALGSSPLVSLQASAFSAFLTVGSSVFLSPWKFSSCRLSLRTNFPTRRWPRRSTRPANKEKQQFLLRHWMITRLLYSARQTLRIYTWYKENMLYFTETLCVDLSHA